MKSVDAGPSTIMEKAQHEWAIHEIDQEKNEPPVQETPLQESSEGNNKKRQRTILEYVMKQQKEEKELQTSETPTKMRVKDKQHQEEAHRPQEPSAGDYQVYATPEKNRTNEEKTAETAKQPQEKL